MLKSLSTPFCALLTAFLLLAPQHLAAHPSAPSQAPETAVSPAMDFSILDAKASRFAQFGEWASTSAMLTLMLDMRPDSAPLYARAIIAEGMQRHPDAQQQLLHAALEHGVPIDSLLAGVRTRSITLGHADLYETFLTDIPRTHPWLRRTIDSYLLRYYIFRRNPRGIITYARIMLQGLPDSQEFLLALASGYVQAGQYPEAIATYQHILTLNPDNLTALLYIGNYLLITGEPRQARPYLDRANTLAPTPYLATLLH